MELGIVLEARSPAASCSYALAEATGCPLLCVGDDFSLTDLTVWTPSLS